MHTIYVGMKDAHGRVPSEGIHDIRRNRRTPWRTTAKRIYEAVQSGVAYESVEEIPVVLQQYAHAARIICQRERMRPYLRAASILIVAVLSAVSACSNTIAGPAVASPPPRTVAVPPPSDVAHWVPAVRGLRP